jgi:hypothetical protein
MAGLSYTTPKTGDRGPAGSARRRHGRRGDALVGEDARGG